MAKTTQKQLISSLKQMKEIKPRKEWAVLLKSQILAEQKSEPVQAQFSFASVISNFKFQISNSFIRRLSYSFAVIIFLIIGAFGFSGYTMPGDLLFPAKKISEYSIATLLGQTKLNQDVSALNNRINELAQVAKEDRKSNIPSAISEITEAVKVLKTSTVKSPETLKNIAISLKTLADVPGTDLSENSDVKDLYQTVVQAQIADLQETTLTDAQLEIMVEVKELYLQGKYSVALEKILLINQ